MGVNLIIKTGDLLIGTRASTIVRITGIEKDYYNVIVVRPSNSGSGAHAGMYFVIRKEYVSKQKNNVKDFYWRLATEAEKVLYGS